MSREGHGKGELGKEQSAVFREVCLFQHQDDAQKGALLDELTQHMQTLWKNSMRNPPLTVGHGREKRALICLSCPEFISRGSTLPTPPTAGDRWGVSAKSKGQRAPGEVQSKQEKGGSHPGTLRRSTGCTSLNKQVTRKGKDLPCSSLPRRCPTEMIILTLRGRNKVYTTVPVIWGPQSVQFYSSY